MFMSDVMPRIDPKTWLESMDALPVAVFVVDDTARPVYLNQKARALIPEPARSVGMPLHEQGLLHVLDVRASESNKPYPAERFPVLRALQGETASEDDIALRLNRKIRFFQVSAAPIPTEGATPRFAVATFMDISARKEIETQLKWRNLELQSLIDQVSKGKQDLRALSKRLLTVQEEERRHIARELHDQVGQALTILKIKLQTLPRSQDAGGETHILSGKDMAEMLQSIEHTLEQVRNLSVDLRPSVLDDLGLVSALRWYVDRQARLSGMAIKFQPLSAVDRIAPEIETACFRLVQEALTNIIRHSAAAHSSVLLERDEAGIHLRILDDGRGFDVMKAHEKARAGQSSGLLGMKERVHLLEGLIDIKSDAAKGTRIIVFFPLARPEEEPREEGR